MNFFNCSEIILFVCNSAALLTINTSLVILTFLMSFFKFLLKQRKPFKIGIFIYPIEGTGVVRIFDWEGSI